MSQALPVVPIGRVAMSDAEIDAVTAVLRSGKLRQGPVCGAFEKEFAVAVGADHAVAVSSGSAALFLAYRCVLEPGDEVLVPSFTFIATASMVVAAGGRPIFCDVDPSTFTLDVKDMERRLTPRTRAVAPVHLFGTAVNVGAIQDFAAEHDLAIVWDAAQAHGTRINGVDVGSLPGLVCYSFYPSKNMTTGEGGMVTTQDPELDRRLRLLRSHGQAQKYCHTEIGYNLRLTDVQAAIGRVQLRSLPAWIAARRDNARVLQEAVELGGGFRIQAVLDEVEHSYHQFSITVDSERLGKSRDDVVAAFARHGIETAVHYPRPLHRQPVFEEMFEYQELPVSELLSETILSLPVHHNLSRTEVERVADAVVEIGRGRLA